MTETRKHEEIDPGSSADPRAGAAAPGRAGRLIAIFYDGSTAGADYMGWKAALLFEKYGEG